VNVLNVNGLRVLKQLLLVTLGAMIAVFSSSVLLPSYADTHKQAPVVLMLGNSLTAGYGLDAADTVPVRLQQALRDAGTKAQIINGGVSGDTTAGGSARIDWLFADGAPDVLVIELGGNDGLRGIDPSSTRKNLEVAIVKGLDAGAVVVLAGMYAPPNLGESYETEFNGVFPDLAAQYSVIFYPFFLEGVAGDISLNQPDGIHPNEEGVRVIVKRFLPTIMKALEQVRLKNE